MTQELPLNIRHKIDHLLASGGRKILGLSGAPGAGKSTFAAQIAAALGSRCQVVPMDGFHLAQAEIDRLGLSLRKGSPATFDSAGYVALLQRIRHQQTDEIIYAPTFNRTLEEPIAGAIAVLPETELIVTEGNYLLLQDGAWRGVRTFLDAVWYVDVDTALRRKRLLARHRAFGRSEAAAMVWMAGNDDLNAAVIESSKHSADWVVNVGGDRSV
jgi:pantothenate kinase